LDRTASLDTCGSAAYPAATFAVLCRVKREEVMKKTALTRVMALLLATSALSFSQFALAHAHLKSPVPADKAVVDSSPKNLTLTFTEDIEVAFSGVEVLNAQQQPVALEKVKLNDQQHAQLIVPLSQPLPSGSYQVNWHVLSVDGHKTKGSYAFSVK
jgi:methionine-rich copper-binding protein CopC